MHAGRVGCMCMCSSGVSFVDHFGYSNAFMNFQGGVSILIQYLCDAHTLMTNLTGQIIDYYKYIHFISKKLCFVIVDEDSLLRDRSIRPFTGDF